jgi:23S rRNA (adenine2030-N6)-methyltransferase
MNYRHAYHAGNFADVVKHAVLARVLTYMKLKPQPFRVVDTHAGAGQYDLGGIEASKTGEWHDGIERLIRDADMPAAVAALLAPYLNAVRSANTHEALTIYPGSPVIARQLMRPGDHLVANELHLEDFAALKSVMRAMPDTRVLNTDAWVAIKALLPPPERRAVTLIDPPFENASEFEDLTQAVGNGLRRFANGVYLIWYPVKQAAAADRLVQDICAFGCRNILDIRLMISDPFPGLGLTQTGLLILNPPFVLKAELEQLLPYLAARLGQGRGSGFRLTEPADRS